MRQPRDSVLPNPRLLRPGAPRRRRRLLPRASAILGLALAAACCAAVAVVAMNGRDAIDRRDATPAGASWRETSLRRVYEDQIAALRAEISARDQQNARLEAALGALERQASGLDDRLSALAALAARVDPAQPSERPPSQKLGLRGATPEIDDEASIRLATDRTALARLEMASVAMTKKLLRPVAAENARIVATLDELGLAPERLTPPSKAAPRGGPLEGWPSPPPGATAFAQAYGALNEAVARRAFLRAALPHAPLRAPLTGAHEVSSGYGYRLDPFFGRPALHGGLDFVGAYGENVRAAASGTVTVAGEAGGYGDMVEIDHGGGLVTRYGHLSEIFVIEGQKIAAGAQIGALGSSGRSTGPHLHYEIRDQGAPVDPAPFLRAGRLIAPTS